MPRIPLLVTALAAFVSAAHAADPQPPAVNLTLTCWQGGIKIIEETGVSKFPIIKSGIAVRKGDGTGLHLFSDENIQAFCMLRLPKDLPKEAFSY